jgi:hypothetical protein
MGSTHSQLEECTRALCHCRREFPNLGRHKTGNTPAQESIYIHSINILREVQHHAVNRRNNYLAGDLLQVPVLS